jgi:RHS repeat-associated protein
MFTGRRYDEESGLYYYRARMYNPGLGRFLQTDPMGYIDTVNPYAYCANNPLNWIDPWGEKIYSRGEVETILNSGRNAPYNPLRHGFPSEIAPGYSNSNLDIYDKLGLIPGYDYGAGSEKCVDIYDVPQHGPMTATGFSNYVAGYLGGYHGSIGLGALMCAFGNMYENKNIVFWTGDDEESICDINNGMYDGIKRRRSDIKDTLGLMGNVLIENTPHRGFYE